MARHVAVALSLAAAVWIAQPCDAQTATVTSASNLSAGLPVGGEIDNYVRYLQTIGRAPVHAWTVRDLGLRDAARRVTDSVGANPWSGTALLRTPVTRGVQIVAPSIAMRLNSAYPYGGNDGPIWAGRGVTAAVEGGVRATYGALTVVLAPSVFATQNAGFTVEANGQTGTGRYRDADFPGVIDRPQRFGDGAYARVDPGDSRIELTVGSTMIGVTTANQWWGPATEFPYLVGNNAAGVPHVYVGTAAPVSTPIGHVQARVVYGMEQQSAFSPVTGPNAFTDPVASGRLRRMSGLVLSYQPRGVPGLELGGARYFHEAWTGSFALSDLRTPFEGLLKKSVPRGYQIVNLEDRDALRNQLASVFMRWVLPHSGFEFYGEYGHEDFNYDLRDLYNEPDHSRAALVGVRKVFAADTARSFMAFRAEYLDATSPSLGRHRSEGGTYIHVPLKQGHTYLGQVIGANIGVGSAAGAIAAVDRYDRRGRTTLYVRRIVQNNASLLFGNVERPMRSPDITGAVGVERMRLGGIGNATAGVAAVFVSQPDPGPHGWNLSVYGSFAFLPQ